MKRAYCPESKKRRETNGNIRYKPNPVKEQKLRELNSKEKERTMNFFWQEAV